MNCMTALTQLDKKLRPPGPGSKCAAAFSIFEVQKKELHIITYSAIYIYQSGTALDYMTKEKVFPEPRLLLLLDSNKKISQGFITAEKSIIIFLKLTISAWQMGWHHLWQHTMCFTCHILDQQQQSAHWCLPRNLAWKTWGRCKENCKVSCTSKFSNWSWLSLATCKYRTHLYCWICFLFCITAYYKIINNSLWITKQLEYMLKHTQMTKIMVEVQENPEH